MTPLAKPKVLTLLFASTFAFAAPSAHAIDLVVHASTVAKALKAQVFKDKGRYYLQKPGPCNDPYLENPTVSFKEAVLLVGALCRDGSWTTDRRSCQSANIPLRDPTSLGPGLSCARNKLRWKTFAWKPRTSRWWPRHCKT